MAKNAKKVKSLGLESLKVEPAVESVVAPTSEVKAEAPKVGGRVIRGHKYDGKSLSEKGLATKLQIGNRSPKAPRGTGKPSVMYRVFALVSGNPGITVGDLVTKMQAESWSAHPTPYGRKEVVEGPWCLDYIKGAIAKGFLAVSE